jgi:hypothetical protein
MFYGFPKEKKHIWANSRKGGLVHSGHNIAYPIILYIYIYIYIIYLFIYIKFFEPNLVLVNVNKL